MQFHPNKYGFWQRVPVLLCLLAAGPRLAAQTCFNINPAKSKVNIDLVANVAAPDDGDTLYIPCTAKVTNFSIGVDFFNNTEQYFEDSTLLVATLIYKGQTFILQYDKGSNTYKIPSNPPNLSAGNYFFTLSTSDCAPNGMPCDSCMVTYCLEVVYTGNITINADITPKPDPPVLRCTPGDSVLLTGALPPNNNFSTQWFRVVGTQLIKISGASTNTYAAYTAGTYQYKVSGPSGCTGSATVKVLPPEFPSVAIVPDTQVLVVCAQPLTGVVTGNDGGGSANLLYGWSASGGGFIKSGASAPVPIIGAPGNYTLVVTRKDNACTASATANVMAGNLPVVQVAISPDPPNGRLDCIVTSVKLTASASATSGSTNFAFAWASGAGPATAVSVPGDYAVTATDLNSGCQGVEMVTVTQDLSKPELSILSPRDTLCSGESVALTALTQEPVAIAWSDNSTTSVLTVAPASLGDHVYAVTVTANDNGCTQTAAKTIYMLPVPEAMCSDPVVVVQNNQNIDLDCSVSDGDLFWIASTSNIRNIPPFGSGPVLNQAYELINSQAPGSVQYLIYGKNPGCTGDRMEVVINVMPRADGDIFIPELITPNGDGMNDTWKIVVPDAISNPEAYSLVLFNRYGTQVYSGNLAMTFDANPYPDGTYYYILTGPGGLKTRGAVTVLRRQ